MKKLYFYIIIIVILTLVIVIGKQNNRTSSLRSDKRDFSISDTSLVTKMTLKNRNLETINLYRNSSNHWVLNDSLKANKYLINLVLKTIKEMRIKSPIARSALPNIIKRMAIQNTKIEVFQKYKKIKTIYIGGETQDQLGTFMMIEGAQEPYIVHIPGFNGYLSSRFSCKEHVWRSKQIFNKHITRAQYVIENINKTIETTSITQLINIYCEAFLSDNDNFKINDIKTRIPFFSLETIDQNGTRHTLYCIRKKPVNKEKYQDHKYDRERFYGSINNTLMLIQYKQFEAFTQTELIMDYFMPWQNLNSF